MRKMTDKQTTERQNERIVKAAATIWRKLESEIQSKGIINRPGLLLLLVGAARATMTAAEWRWFLDTFEESERAANPDA
jgi:hypothetical protein